MAQALEQLARARLDHRLFARRRRRRRHRIVVVVVVVVCAVAAAAAQVGGECVSRAFALNFLAVIVW